ncbi:MAG TPA: EutN/CcmL family microcompartment protein [Phycisphaerae bacterium]|nr:EutN/CcmL family microcompartment protein [Phycisphaerae bacterium]
MITGVVTGEIVSTINHPFYNGKRMLIVEKTDEHGKRSDDYIIAVAAVEAGVGDSVLIVDEGNGARQILRDSSGPVRSVVVGIIDEVHVG